MYAYSCLGVLSMSFFFVMQKTAYERRISDWSSYVCSSDLAASLPVRTIGEPEGVELAYETVDWRPAESGRITDAIYEEYGLQAIRIPGAQAHQQGCQHPEDTELADGESRERCTQNAADVCRDRPRGCNCGRETQVGDN